MPIIDELRADGIDTDNRAAVIAHLAKLPIPPDRREGYLRIYSREKGIVPSLSEIEQARAAPR